MELDAVVLIDREVWGNAGVMDKEVAARIVRDDEAVSLVGEIELDRSELPRERTARHVLLCYS